MESARCARELGRVLRRRRSRTGPSSKARRDQRGSKVAAPADQTFDSFGQKVASTAEKAANPRTNYHPFSPKPPNNQINRIIGKGMPISPKRRPRPICSSVCCGRTRAKRDIYRFQRAREEYGPRRRRKTLAARTKLSRRSRLSAGAAPKAQRRQNASHSGERPHQRGITSCPEECDLSRCVRNIGLVATTATTA